MAPGLALFYGGMVRSKSVLNMMMMTFGSLAVITVVWVLVGLLAGLRRRPRGRACSGTRGSTPASGSCCRPPATGAAHVPLILFAVFQGLFCVITGALVSGAIADRARFGAWMVFVGALDLVVYAPVAHWVFDVDRGGHVGGWLVNRRRPGRLRRRHRGGDLLRVPRASPWRWCSGRRVGFGKDPMRPHNLTLVMLGAGLLWFGWFGFNAGSALGADQTAAVVFTTTLVAGAAGALGWLVVERLRDGHATSLGAASGLVAGLVAITPSCGSLSPLGAIVMGGVAGVVCAWAVGLKYRFGVRRLARRRRRPPGRRPGRHDRASACSPPRRRRPGSTACCYGGGARPARPAAGRRRAPCSSTPSSCPASSGWSSTG